ncbi:MAG: hypothetical protein IPM38_10570 [Ignavibacteria bacterium]|nr:hypothetical protein [Ignavibacteria bacterium]
MKTYYFIFIVLFSLINPVQSQTPVYYQGFPVIVDTLRKQFQKAGGPLITDLENDGQKENNILLC